MNIIKSIIPFDLLIDTDMGVLKYVQVSYPHDYDLFYSNLMDMVGPEHNDFLQYILTRRGFSNPLSVIIKPEKMITIHPDLMLKKLLRKEIVYKLSMSTAIMRLVCKSFFVQDALRFDILCKNEYEKKYLLDIFNENFKTNKVPSTILISDEDDIDTDLYGNIYVKDVHDICKFKQPLEGKNIIVANYNFNKEMNQNTGEYIELPLVDVVDKYLSCNKISFIDVYSIDKTKIGVG